MAAAKNMTRRSQLIFEVDPGFSLPPLECCLGVNGIAVAPVKSRKVLLPGKML